MTNNPNQNAPDEPPGHAKRPDNVPEGRPESVEPGERFAVSRFVDVGNGKTERRWFVRKVVDGRHIGPGTVVHTERL